MHVEFEYMPEDFREAQSAHANAAFRLSRGMRRIVTVINYLVMIGYGMLYARYGTWGSGASAWSVALGSVLVPLCLWMVILTLNLIDINRRANSESMRPWRTQVKLPTKQAGGLRGNLLIAVFVLLILIAFAVAAWMHFVAETTNTTMSTIERFELGFCAASAAISLYSLWVLITHRIRARSAVLWNTRNFYGSHVAEISGDRITIAAPHCRTEYAWKAIQGFIESPNLLLLYVTPTTFQILPKRAFADLAQLDAFRAILAQQVREGRFLPNARGFAVVNPPPAPVPPIPSGSS